MTLALITGASRGLGRSAALHLADQGSDVILTYQRNREAADQVVEAIRAKGRRAVALPLDVADSDSFADFVEQVRAALRDTWQTDRFDHLINNAGIGINTPFAETSEEQFDTLMRIHLKGPFFLTQRLLPLIADGGRIVNISSGLARFCMPGFAAYATMKGGLEVLTRYLAHELGERGIAVNTLAPGAIETDFGGGVIRDNQEANAQVAGATALGRVGLPDDIGGAIAALLSPGNGWVNGQRIEVAGGVFL
tara:strand:- start:58061 stop:58813 length:753 start_codon:yes stop_codon:yes gene_type:complete